MIKTLPARLVLACVGMWAAGLQIGTAQNIRPVKLEVSGVEKAIAVGERTSVTVRLLDADSHLIPAPKDLDIEILSRLGSGAKVPLTTAKLRKGASSVEVALPAATKPGLLYLWARNGELLLGGAYLRVRSSAAKPAPVKESHALEPPVVSPTPSPVMRAPVMPDRAVPPKSLEVPAIRSSSLPPSLAPVSVTPAGHAFQIALRYSPERTFLANGKDPVTVHAFVMSDGDAAPPGFRLRLFDGSGTLTPKPLVIPPGGEEGTATLTYDHVGVVNVQYLGSDPSASADGSNELQIHFDPPITGLELTASPPRASLVESSEVVATLVDDSGKPISTHDSRVVSFTRMSGRGDFEKQEITIDAGRSEARTKFTPTWWGAATVLASTPNLLRVSTTIDVYPPLGLLAISLIGGLLGGYVFVLQTPESKRWRIPVGALAGIILLWAALFLGLSGLPRTAVLNPISVFVISVVGGWLGTKVFDLLVNQFSPAKS